MVRHPVSTDGSVGPQDTQCAGCQGRAATANSVRGMIHIPSHHVGKLLTAVTQFDPASAEDPAVEDEATKIKASLSAILVGRGGHIFANTVAPPVNDADRLPADITPTVRLVTAFAGFHKEHGEDGPVSFFGIKDHGEVFENCWKKGSN